MKKILSFVLALAMVCTVFSGLTAFASDAFTLEMSSATAKAGETVTLEMSVTSNPGITAMAVNIAYPAELSLTAKATDKKLFGTAGTVGGSAAANPYKYLWSDDFDNFYETGVLYTIPVKVADDALPGTYTITVTVPNGSTYDADMNDVDVVTVNGVITVEDDAPVVPTAADLGLFTDASQNFKVAESIMTSNGYAIEKALGFVSGINAEAAVVAYGTEITCEGFAKVLDIPAVNTYAASETVKGFVAAVTSIRNENLGKAFTAKAYADVTVGEETIRVYVDNAATAVYAN